MVVKKVHVPCEGKRWGEPSLTHPTAGELVALVAGDRVTNGLLQFVEICCPGSVLTDRVLNVGQCCSWCGCTVCPCGDRGIFREGFHGVLLIFGEVIRVGVSARRDRALGLTEFGLAVFRGDGL